MLPWGHLAVGYLVYSLGGRLWNQRAPDGVPTLVLIFGTQFPDLLDKPLNWWFSILDGRGIGHSLLTMTLLCGLLVSVARVYNRRELATAFTIGVYTHLLGDSWRALLSGRYADVSFLLWPLFPAPTYPKDSFADHFDVWILYLQVLIDSPPRVLLTGPVAHYIAVFGLITGLWAFDGFPGLKTSWQLITLGRYEDKSNN